MSRTVNLLICITVLVCGITLETPAENRTSTVPATPCCGNERMGSSDHDALDVSECLQYKLFEDETSVLWSADVYLGSLCGDSTEQFIWTAPGQVAPQFCNGEPECLHPPAEGICPALQQPLPKNKSYIDLLKKPVRYPGLPVDKTWNPQDGLKDLGEMRTTFVKVKNADGKYFAVRLSAGIAEMEKVNFPAGAFPKRPKLPNRKILIGFEVQMDAADVGKYAEAVPKVWTRYPNCPTAFVVTVENSDYYVTTTAANGIRIPDQLISPMLASPIEKRSTRTSVNK